MDPKHKSSDADNSAVPKRSCKVPHLNENMKVLDLMKEKIIMLFTVSYFS